MTDAPRFPNYTARMPTRHPTSFSAHPNGIPMAAYMDPMYVTRQQAPGLRPPINPFMYPGMNAPMNPFDQPRIRLPSMPLGENTQSQSRKDTDASNHKQVERDLSTKSSKENPTSVQRLPGINTITSALSQQKQVLESQSPVNGFPTGAVAGYSPSSLAHDASKLPRPPQRSPIHMLPAHNGQMFYRYYDPAYQPNQPTPGMYMNHPNRPMCPPFPGQYLPPGFPFPGQVSPDVSPKRKRRKTPKSVIESHSAHLAAASAETTALGNEKLSKVSEKIVSSASENLGNAPDATIKSGIQ